MPTETSSACSANTAMVPDTFARPKGIAVDGDGHIWVADEMEDRLQVFNREGQLLTYIGLGHGELPGQFKALVGVAIDKQNRVFTTEQYPGRLQVFRYVTDAEAAAEKAKHDEESKKAADRTRKARPRRRLTKPQYRPGRMPQCRRRQMQLPRQRTAQRPRRRTRRQCLGIDVTAGALTPQGLKPLVILALFGTTQVVP